MKALKWVVMLLCVAGLLVGCGTAAKESGFWENETMYKNLDHLKFSWGGYKKPDEAATKKTEDQEWWGKTVEATPDK